MSNLKNIYGFHAVTARLKHDANSLELIYYDANRLDKRMQSFLMQAENANVRLIKVDHDRLNGLAGGAKHQGVVAQANESTYVSGPKSIYNVSNQKQEPLPQTIEELQDLISEPLFLLVLDCVTDPHNFGACIRTANAAGIHAIIVPRDKSATLNATVLKVASGAAETLPIITITNLARTLRHLKELDVHIIGTESNASKSLYQTELKGNLAIVMGGEGNGMRRLTRECCDEFIHIPMSGTVESLNVSVASSIVLFEAVRQRSYFK